jgi:RNAse (barnase) inhibitor barstar
MPLDDISPYRKYVDHFDISEEQKVELIHAVWNIMEGVVDLAFGKNSVQLCGAASSDQDGLQDQTSKVISLLERKHPDLRNKLRAVDDKDG